MAREIKLVKNKDDEINVRGIRDTIARGEKVIAARWQSDGVKIACPNSNHLIRLLIEVGYDEKELGEHISHYGEVVSLECMPS